MLLQNEMKRLYLRKSTRILFFFAILIMISAPFLAVVGVHVYQIDSSGNVKILKGMDAIQVWNKIETEFSGEVTEEDLERALDTYKQLRNCYGEDIPSDIYIKEVYPITQQLNFLTYLTPSDRSYDALLTLDAKDAQNFYNARDKIVENFLSSQLADNPELLKKALQQNSKIPTPFLYYPMRGLESALSSVGAIIFIWSFIGCFIGATCFSPDRQSHAVDIFYTTKMGKKSGRVRLFCAFTSITFFYIISVLLYLSVCVTLYGVDGLKTSIQYSGFYSVQPYNYGQVYVFSCLIGLFTVLSITALSSLVSALMISPVFSFVTSIAFLMLSFVVGNITSVTGQFIAAILPGSGISVYGELFRYNYWGIKGMEVWSPILMLASSIFFLVLFTLLTLMIYKKYYRLNS